MRDAIERLCDDVVACTRMGANARAMFEAEYSQAIAIGKWRDVLFGFHHNKLIIAPSFPRRRESNFHCANLDSRLRGNDGKLLLE